MLNAISRPYDEYNMRQHQRHYFGEFYEDDFEESNFGEDLRSIESWQGGPSGSSPGTPEQELAAYEGSTEGTTVTTLTTVLVQHVAGSIASLSIDGLELEIPFAEQDDPLDDEVQYHGRDLFNNILAILGQSMRF